MGEKIECRWKTKEEMILERAVDDLVRKQREVQA